MLEDSEAFVGSFGNDSADIAWLRGTDNTGCLMIVASQMFGSCMLLNNE